ncbi:MAG: succinate dehydrogenase assembly factor 2 [Rhizobiaceae bacterium]|nr:succinate dehydrogenase assembly factor 2 [Rhizobiaceae bacterium]
MRENELLDNRRKQLRYRANHRGIKEMDIILGKFADSFIDGFDHSRLDEFEALMDNNDRDLLQWYTGELAIPAPFDTELFAQILSHAKTVITNSED